MFIIGLTGSIAMGKSTVARMFRQAGVPVINADAIVHALLKEGSAVFADVVRHFPEACQGGVINRSILGRKVFADKAAKEKLESLLHPAVRRERKKILAGYARQRRPVVVLEIPLLFETGAERLCDVVVVVSASGAQQERRALQRDGMTREKLAQILAGQMSDREKRRRADVIIPTGQGYAVTRRAAHHTLNATLNSHGKVWSAGY